jgi:hypothetical protein
MGTYDDKESIRFLLYRVSQAATRQLKLLLEEKHMYQKVAIGFDECAETIEREVLISAWKKEFAERTRMLKTGGGRFSLLNKMPSYGDIHEGKVLGPVLVPENIKMFCEKCDRREAFAPIWYKDITDDLRRATEPPAMPYNFQMLCLIFHCQSCKGTPETVLVRQEEWQLFLHGRSPIEHIEIPPYIPKIGRHWFRDAVIALHGGKTLAAIFYLRTFIEQFARRQTGISGKKTGADIMSSYQETLPPKQRDSMPSLREWYDKLSEALHSAREDVELFESARTQIEYHFEIRRVFKMPESAPVPSGSGTPSANG